MVPKQVASVLCTTLPPLLVNGNHLNTLDKGPLGSATHQDSDELGKLPMPGRPTIWMIVGQGPIALTVGAGLFGHFYSHLSFFLLFLPLFGRRPDID